MQMRRASHLAVTVLFLAFPSIASAQDVMQLDTMFRDSLLRKPEPQARGEEIHHHDGQAVVTRRHRHKKL